MSNATDVTIDEVVAKALGIFNATRVKSYLADHGEEFRGTERPFEAGDAIRSALIALGTEDIQSTDYEERPPHDWPEAEDLLIAQIKDYDQQIERRKKLCRDG